MAYDSQLLLVLLGLVLLPVALLLVLIWKVRTAEIPVTAVS